MQFFKSWRSADACRPLPTLDAEQTARYRRFRRLLEHNRTALTLQADLEQIYYDNRPFMPQMVEHGSQQLLLEVDGMINALSGMTQKDYEPLLAVLRSIERSVRTEWSGYYRQVTEILIIALDEITQEVITQVGAKAANLANVAAKLALSVPKGFVVTTAACHKFLLETGLTAEIDDLLAELIDDDPANLESVSRKIGDRISATPLPTMIQQALKGAVHLFPADQRLAVRSSAIGEDGEISFAGQYTSLLNVSPVDLPQAYRQVVASLYSASALSYRMHHGLDDRETPMAVLVLEMIEPQYSGVVYTADPAGADQESIRISAVAGLGDQLVGGDASPEQLNLLNKKSLNLLAGGKHQVSTPIPLEFLEKLAKEALRMEELYGHALDIEWAMDQSAQLIILQVRPLLVMSAEEAHDEEVPLTSPVTPCCSAAANVPPAGWRAAEC
jgi:pyruvate, water dikinase